MSDATAAIGATITINGVPIAEVGDISGPEYSTDMIEVTSHDSPGHGEEKIPGVKRWGQVSFPMNSVPSDPGQQDLWIAWEDSTRDTYVVTRTDGIIEGFTGAVATIGRNANITDRNMMDVAIEVLEAPYVLGDS
jgi:predicted secreted protein